MGWIVICEGCLLWDIDRATCSSWLFAGAGILNFESLPKHFILPTCGSAFYSRAPSSWLTLHQMGIIELHLFSRMIWFSIRANEVQTLPRKQDIAPHQLHFNYILNIYIYMQTEEDGHTYPRALEKLMVLHCSRRTLLTVVFMHIHIPE